MTYALRKLIAFVFLGGIFWFIYQDLDNVGKPWFMHALGLIVVLFAFFWLLVPVLVVRFRIYARRRHNRQRHAEWRASLGGGAPRPVAAKRGAQSLLAPGEEVFLHEKGTLYVPAGSPLGGDARPGAPSEVAFPGFDRRRCGRIQRVHCYVTGKRVLFAGKALSVSVPFADLKSFWDTPGGIVFKFAHGGGLVRAGFTFQNPLVAADILQFAKRAPF